MRHSGAGEGMQGRGEGHLDRQTDRQTERERERERDFSGRRNGNQFMMRRKEEEVIL